MVPEPDPYATVGVKPTANAAEISSVYRRAVKAARASGAVDRAARLAAAYAVIGNPVGRAAYEARRRSAAKARGKETALEAANDPALQPLRHHRRRTSKSSSGWLDMLWALFEWLR
ncbi:MAG TPA: hypothetical protein VLY04_18975 [Bryobacteraceae bacterium]|nr:hypothetical protein [Bryobacteraceae bacterium]